MRARIILIYLIGIEMKMTKVEDVIVNTTTVAVNIDIENQLMKEGIDTKRTVKEGIDTREKVRGGIVTKKMERDVTGMRTKKRGGEDTKVGVETKKYLLSKLKKKIIIQMKNSENHKIETEKLRAIGVESQITQDSLTKAAQLSVVL